MSGTLVRREPDTLDYVAEYERLKAGCVAAALDRHQLSRDDAEALYQTAWIELWQYARAGNVVHDLRAFLIDVMTKRWRDELRRSHRRHESLGVEEGLADVAAAVLAEPDAGVYDDRVQINFAAEVLATTLDDESLRRVFYLIWFEGMSREAAVSAAGLAWNRTMAKRLDRVAKRLRKSLGAVRAGDWCEHQRVLLQDFALGRLAAGGTEYLRARHHLASCSACRFYVLTLRGMAVLGPPPGLLAQLASGGLSSALPAGAGAVLAGGAAASSGAGAGGVAIAGLGAGTLKAIALSASVAALAGGAVVTTVEMRRDPSPPPARSRPAARPSSRPVAASRPPASPATIAASSSPVSGATAAAADRAAARRAAARERRRATLRARRRAERERREQTFTVSGTQNPATGEPEPPVTITPPQPVQPPRQKSSGFTGEFSP